MKMHQLKRKNPNKKARLIGRGGKRGKTSGHGTKGQKARAGRKMRPELRDLIKKLPKLRGYKFHGHAPEAFPVNTGTLELYFENGETVSPKTLKEKGIMKKPAEAVKVLADGDLSKKLTIEGCLVSASAAEKITKAGGKIPEAAKAAKGK